MPLLRLAAPALAAAGALALAAFAPACAKAQRVTREEVVARAVSRGPRLAIARADSSAALAQLSLARQYENPFLGLSYSKSAPQQHITLDVPLDFPWLRTARIGSAQAGLGAAAHRYAFLREAVAFDADTTYTRALAAAAKARLSKRTSLDADSLLVIARLRRDAGDASELDVQLATVNGGQLANAAASDSLEAIGALLAVQAVMGMPADVPVIALADTLQVEAVAVRAEAGGTPLLVAAAEEDARSAELALKLEQRRLFPGASLSFGYETRDPTGSEPGTLPTIGVALPLPLFNQNGASVEFARAQRDRAISELSLARIEVNAALARARRASAVAQERASRSQRLLQGANQVAALSLLAYREGATTLASALEAQRTARDVQAQYVEDVALARNTTGLVRLLTLTANRPEQ
jgi:cobalt-zinc-cadmium efflux system outer membrane protein